MTRVYAILKPAKIANKITAMNKNFPTCLRFNIVFAPPEIESLVCDMLVTKAEKNVENFPFDEVINLRFIAWA
jgi:hypothetical protein